MSEHPTPEVLKAFLQGGLRPGVRGEVVSHLLHGCTTCGRLAYPTPVDRAAYDVPIDTAIAKAKRRFEEREAAKVWVAGFIADGPMIAQGPFEDLEWVATRGFVEVLLETSASLRHKDPKRMVELATIATAAAEELAELSIQSRRDLKAQCWGELANAYRCADEIDLAEEALYTAFAHFDRGTGDVLLLARLDDIAASFFAARRQFDEVFACLDEAHVIYSEAGDTHASGRILISKGLLSGYDGDHEEGISLLLRGLSQIDRDRDPDLVYQGLHNILLFTVELEEYEEAWQLLKLLRPLAVVRAGRVLVMKLTAVEGKVAAGLGHMAEAESLLNQAREALEEEGLIYISAVTGLDLAAVYFRQNRTEDLRDLVAEMVATFRCLRVEREALAALLMLHKAAARERVTLELIDQVAHALRRIGDEQPRRAV